MSKTNIEPSDPNETLIDELNLSELNIADFLDPPTKEAIMLDMLDTDLDSEFLDELSYDNDDEPSTQQEEVFMNEGSILCTDEADKEDMVATPTQMDGPNLPMDEITIDYPDDFEEYLDSDQISTILHECSTCNGMFISDEEYDSHSCQVKALNIKLETNVTTKPKIEDVVADPASNAVESDEPKKPGLNVIRKHLRKPKNIKVVKKVETDKDKLSVRTRNDHGNHFCQICDKSLSRRSSLTIHMRRHTGEMPFECDYCEKKFVVLYDLDRHMLTHMMGARKYTCCCDLCRKPFVSRSGMIQHKRIHHGCFTLHPCDVCGQTFSGKSKLLTHKISHLKVGKYKLDIENADEPNVQVLLLYDNLT